MDISTNNVNEIMKQQFTLKNENDIQTVLLTDVMEYDIYDNIEQFIQDHSYLLKSTDNINNILTNSIKFNDFFNYLQSNKNKVRFTDQNEEILYARAKDNEDADYHFLLLKNGNDKINYFLNDVIKEFEADENNQIY